MRLPPAAAAWAAVGILEIVGPVFLVVVLGLVLARVGLLTPAFTVSANRFTYWIALPAMLGRELALASHDLEGAGPLVGMLFLTTAVLIPLGYLLGKFLGVRWDARGTFVHACYRGNLAYVALPIIYALPATSGTAGAALRSTALVAMAPTVLLFNATAVAILLISQHAADWRLPLRVLRETAKNPILLASAAGMLWSFTDRGLTPFVERTLGIVGQSALPLALLCVGTALATTRLTGNRRLVAIATTMKVGVGPAIGWALAQALGLDPTLTKIGLILLATPSAAAGYAMVTQLGGDEALAAGAITASTAASALALAIIVAL